MRRLPRLLAGLGLGAALWAGALAGLAPPALAASCRVVTVQNAVPVGLALSPDKTSVAYGGCVQFNDQAFGPPVTVTVAGGYHVTLDFGESTSGKTNYAATVPGAHQVTADNGGASAKGQITVGPAPSSSPSPSPSHSPAATPSPGPSPSAAASQSSGPRVARTPRQGGSAPPPLTLPTAAPPPRVPAVTSTPAVPPSVAGSPPGPVPTSTPAAVAGAGPLEPPSDRGLGLPAALAGLVAVGVGTALLRAVLAEPAVDSRRTVGGTA
ncbi:MAG TPA: hypothetical protein VFJ98_07945 [Mycobacteriales bacterium]|nr:hypothetical protein [Mycobacteriales bacterium]